MEKLPQRNSHRIFSRVDGFLAHLLRATILAVLQQPALVNAFQISAGAMSSDPGDESFLQEIAEEFCSYLGVRHKAS
ncbi:MAG TPA: hypothetical protein VGQ61_16640 [Candidatus Angelobacter sp.]|nr:hypothetical protein [Candidatus Angelobacter sp.]